MYGGDLGFEPGMRVALPDIHGAAHDHEDVEVIEAGNRLTRIQLHGVHQRTVFAQVIAKYARVFAGDVLKD
jgi:hypothetical protein